MPFIEATRSDHAGKPVHINVDHVVSVSRPGNQTVISTSAPAKDGCLAYVVDESVAIIMERIRTAQAYSR